MKLFYQRYEKTRPGQPKDNEANARTALSNREGVKKTRVFYGQTDRNWGGGTVASLTISKCENFDLSPLENNISINFFFDRRLSLSGIILRLYTKNRRYPNKGSSHLKKKR